VFVFCYFYLNNISIKPPFNLLSVRVEYELSLEETTRIC
jgi:hypothetical protein